MTGLDRTGRSRPMAIVFKAQTKVSLRDKRDNRDNMSLKKSEIAHSVQTLLHATYNSTFHGAELSRLAQLSRAFAAHLFDFVFEGVRAPG
jgi:hypothetical protein